MEKGEFERVLVAPVLKDLAVGTEMGEVESILDILVVEDFRSTPGDYEDRFKVSISIDWSLDERDSGLLEDSLQLW